jgi:hypothetical protein
VIHQQDYAAGMPVRVKSIDRAGRLAAIGDPYSKGVQFHSEPWNQNAWYVHFEETDELRLFNINQIEPIDEGNATTS